ncbi:MAG: hypothetical protein AB7T63_00645 [Planctomycetota bacterium]
MATSGDVVYFGWVTCADPWEPTEVDVALSWDGGPTVETKTDAAGRYEMPPAARPRTSVLAKLRFRQGDQEHEQLAPLGHLMPSRWRLPNVRLGKTGGMDVRVVLEARAVEGAEVLVSMGGTEYWARGTTSADGVVRGLRVVEGNVLALARGPDGQRGFAIGRVPASQELEVELKPLRHVRVHVLADESDEPVPGAEVLVGSPLQPPPRGPGMLPPVPSSLTNEEGEAIVECISGARASVVVWSEALQRNSGGIGWLQVPIPPDADEVVVRLRASVTLRFPLNGDAPAADTALSVTRSRIDEAWLGPEPRAWIEEGVLCVGPLRPGDDQGVVTASDGCYAPWSVRADGQPTRFVQAPRLTIRALWPDGRPAVDQAFTLWVDGKTQSTATSDQRGEARFDAFDAADVRLGWRCAGQAAQIIRNLRVTGEPVDVVLPRVAPYEITIDGGDVQSERLTFSAAGYPLEPEDALSWYGFVRHDAVEHMGDGTYRFRWFESEDGRSVPICVQAVDKDAPPVRVRPVRGSDGTWRGRVQLERSPQLEVVVIPPADGVYVARLNAVDRDGSPKPGFLHPQSAEQGRYAEDGVHRFRGLPAGSYRMLDFSSGEVSEIFEVGRGPENVRATFDLSDVVAVPGQVRVPTGYEVAGATVEADGRREGRDSKSSPRPVDRSGAFTLRARRGHRLSLAVRHPLLDAADGVVTHVAGSGRVEIHLVAKRPSVRFRVGDDVPLPELLRGGGNPRAPYSVTLAKTVGELPEHANVDVVRLGDQIEFVVPEPGTWAVRIDRFGYEPVTMASVRVERDGVDLGRVQLGRGGALVVRLRPGTQATPEWLAVSATRGGVGGHRRTSASVVNGDPPRSIVTGLGPGRYRVRVQRMYVGDEPPLLETEVDSDGRSTITLDVQLP